MRLMYGLAGLSAVALMTGAAYAGHDDNCCGASSHGTVSRTEVRSEFNGSGARIIGSPCAAPCAEPCEVSACETKVKCCKLDADIEKLRVINPKCSTDLCIQYQVDAECEGQPLDLLVQVKCRDQIVYEKLIPLDGGEPGDETGEFLYTGSFTDSLPQIYDRSLRAEANVVLRGTTTSVDRERERVVRDSRRPHGWAQPLYTTGEVLYTPVRWITTR